MSVDDYNETEQDILGLSMSLRKLEKDNQQLRELNAELLEACKLAQSYYSEDMDQPTARAISAAIAKAEKLR
jgi:hypothetical protein